MQLLPHARFLPLLEASPTSHARSASHLLGQSISQGMPLFKTNKMPVRAARSSMRGLPPLGLGGSSGNSGSITSHSSSVTSSLAILFPTRYPVLLDALRWIGYEEGSGLAEPSLLSALTGAVPR